MLTIIFYSIYCNAKAGDAWASPERSLANLITEARFRRIFGGSLKQQDSIDRLHGYRRKRDFARTSEPKAIDEIGEGGRFVVQKHDARRLHFDLRLELDGVLLSWAIPNGPSLVVAKKRLAVRTEDHPLKYLDFEGAIPKGEYGGGTMIVWDRGTWIPVHDAVKSMAKGHLEFVLFGERLRGCWHLVRLKARAKEKTEQWLLIKAEDAFARAGSEPEVAKVEIASVLSGRSNDELNKPDSVRDDHRKRSAIVAARGIQLPDIKKIPGAREALLRLFVEPALASATEKPPHGEQWRHEIKFDGYRIQARIDADEIRLLTRNGLDWTPRFAGIAEALGGLALGSAILDGELIVEDSAGISSFNDLVSDLKKGRLDRLRYYVFDLLYLNGVDLRGASLANRKRLLAAVLASAPHAETIFLSEHFAIDGAKFFEHVSRLGLEGMISKRSDAPYRSGRSKDWLKTRCVLSQEFVVVGYVPSNISRGMIGSLALGYFENNRLVLAGRVGSGFSQEDAAALFSALDAIKLEKSPLDRKPWPEAEKNIRWVEPHLIVQVQFHGWSGDDMLRHASFRGLRDDKNPSDIVRETGQGPARSDSGGAFALTHPERMLWPADGISKQGLADYYLANAQWILPHLVGRPLSLVRCPGGIAGDCFFAKHGWAGLGDVVRRVVTGEKEPSLIIYDVEGLLSLVQGNVLEIHPWGSTQQFLEKPDRLVFDLDPGDDVSWAAVIEAARDVRACLRAELKLESFVKTTGGKGLHVVVPLIPSIDWERAKSMCKVFAESMAADSPDRYLAKMSKNARKGRIFIDYLRNGRGATAVAAFSTRARPGATVSIPLAWDELSEAIKSDHYSLRNVDRRLANLHRDPWQEFFMIKQKPSEPGAYLRSGFGKGRRPARRLKIAPSSD
jgi:bifunctional non-homologous end joining protein LigD